MNTLLIATLLLASVQTLEVEYSDSAAAERAEVKVSALPEGKRFAFSERWDDTNPRHLAMAEAMAPLGVKATFYLTGGKGPANVRDLVRRLLADGHSIGDHTMNHLREANLLPFALFREIMECRVNLECLCEAPVTAFTAPYVSYTMITDPKGSAARYGRSLVNAGLLGGGEVSPDLTERLSLEPREFTGTYYLSINDRDPRKDLYEKGMRAATNACAAAGAVNGRHVTLGTHTWQSDEGLKRLAAMLEPLARSGEAWFVNENEWIAARHLELDSKVKRVSVRGRRAVYEIDRPDPLELGADVGPFFAFSEKPRFYRLSPLPAGVGVPKRISRLPEGTLGADAGLGLFTLEVVNDSGKPWKNVKTALRLPCGFEPGVVIRSLGALRAGESRKVVFRSRLGLEKSLLGGDFYAAAEINISTASGTERRWAEVRVARPVGRCLSPRDCVRSVGPVKSAAMPPAEALAALSVPGAALPEIAGQKWSAGRGDSPVHPDTMALAFPAGTPYQPVDSRGLFTVEFTGDIAAHGPKWRIRSFIPGPGAKYYLNGRALESLGSVELARGVNRLVCDFGIRNRCAFDQELVIESVRDGARVGFACPGD